MDILSATKRHTYRQSLILFRIHLLIPVFDSVCTFEISFKKCKILKRSFEATYNYCCSMAYFILTSLITKSCQGFFFFLHFRGDVVIVRSPEDPKCLLCKRIAAMVVTLNLAFVPLFIP